MAFLGSIGQILSKVYNRPLEHPLQTIFPLGHIANKLLFTPLITDAALLGKSLLAHHPSPNQDQALNYPYAYLPQQPTVGGAPWDYSTPSQDFSTLPPTYQASRPSAPTLGFSMEQWPEGFSR